MKAKFTITETYSKQVVVELPKGVNYENANEWAEEVANRGDKLFDAESSVGVSDYGDMDYKREITSEEVK